MAGLDHLDAVVLLSWDCYGDCFPGAMVMETLKCSVDIPTLVAGSAGLEGVAAVVTASCDGLQVVAALVQFPLAALDVVAVALQNRVVGSAGLEALVLSPMDQQVDFAGPGAVEGVLQHHPDEVIVKVDLHSVVDQSEGWFPGVET